MMFLILNAISAILVAFCCICRLSVKQFAMKSPLAWSYALLGSSAMVVLCMAAQGITPAMSELASNVGMAVYFVARSKPVRRAWRRLFPNSAPVIK
jgi:hypothetical protein